MSRFNNIDYVNFEEKPIYRKLRIVDKNKNDEESQSLLENEDKSNDLEPNDYESNNKQFVAKESNIKDNTIGDSMKTVNLNSTMPFGYNKTENKYYDSATNTSFNDINELNEIKFSGKRESLIMEVEDTKNVLRHNIQKVYDRESRINDLDERSKNLLNGSEKFNKSSKYLKRKMLFNYLCHFASLVLTIVIIVTFIIILYN